MRLNIAHKDVHAHIYILTHMQEASQWVNNQFKTEHETLVSFSSFRRGGWILHVQYTK